MANVDIEMIWSRIVALEGETFHQKRGQRFTFEIAGNNLMPSTTNQILPKSQFERAPEYVPIEGPGVINHLRGPSYVWAILMDERIRQQNW